MNSIHHATASIAIALASYATTLVAIILIELYGYFHCHNYDWHTAAPAAIILVSHAMTPTATTLTSYATTPVAT